jgi:hypothetical protein
MNVAFLGVFTAQAAMVLLGIGLLMLATALLVLVATEAAEAHRGPTDALLLQKAQVGTSTHALPLRSLIQRQAAAPSRAPPTFPMRQSWIISRDDSLE